MGSFVFSGKDSERCALCNKKFNIGLLVCAHVKKRARCSDSEKKNFSNVAPMCRFGCDELFERGYATIVDGSVKIFHDDELTETIIEYLKTIEGNNCSWYKEESKSFFKWHFENTYIPSKN